MSTSDRGDGALLRLNPDELLTTTRAVRKRLDLSRPVDPAVIEECIRIALQAPNDTNMQEWRFVVVTDARQRLGLAELYRKACAAYQGDPLHVDPSSGGGDYLAAHLHEVPVLVIPCILGRTESASTPVQAAKWASIIPATWSFMLAARARGLGTAWTTWHLEHEREAAAVLGIPYDEVMQAALIPVAYSVGTDFRPARRELSDDVVRWNEW